MIFDGKCTSAAVGSDVLAVKCPNSSGSSRTSKNGHRIVDSEPERADRSPGGVARPDRDMDQASPSEARRGHPADLHRRPVPARDRRRFGCSASLMSRLHQEALAMLTEELEKLKIA